MKHILKYFFSAVLVMLAFTACEKKVEDLPFYNKGTTSVLSSSVSTIAAAPADSLNNVVTFSWTYPNYATDTTTVKYIIEIDTAGGNFFQPVTKTVTGALNISLTGEELNRILLDFGFDFGVASPIKVRLTSSYANNNEQYYSNILSLMAAPYKIPPKIALPASGTLVIVGNLNGWNNSATPEVKYKLDRIDETTFGGIFNYTGGGEFLILPEAGDWSKKYAVEDNTISGIDAGGDFGYFTDGSNSPYTKNFKEAATPGLYKIIIDFQRGTFTVTPFDQQHGLPEELFIVGDATPGEWSNPVPVPSQQLTRVNATKFEVTLPFTSGKKFLLLPTNGVWDRKFGVVDASSPGLDQGGTFKPEGQDTPAPSASGTYKLTVDFIDNSYKFTQ